MLFFVILIVSCSQEESFDNGIKSIKENQEVVINKSDKGIETESEVLRQICENPELYLFEDSNSDLWKEESHDNLKSAYSASLTTTGYDVKSQISSGITNFYYGLVCESRIVPRTSYVWVKYRYKNLIQIPTGATLILPPSSIMSTMYPMGIEPGTTSTVGYSSELVSIGSTYDTYYLITECREITHNAIGQEVFPSSDPVILPCNIGVPSEFLFKYQYSIIEW